MAVVPFPDPLDKFCAEIEDALDPLRAICVDAARRLTPDQRLALEVRLIDRAILACAPLTEGLLRTTDELTEAVLRGLIRP